MKKTVNGQSIWYIYDLAGQLLGEYDATGLVREYMNGPEGRLAVYDVATNGGYWYHNDHLGTPQALTDYTGAVVWTMSQTPFGIATPNEDPDGDGTTITNNIRFPGQYFDAETGLYYNMNRSYDSEHGGRYTQSDPIGLNGGMNTFGYVGGNPVNFIDPKGLAGIDAAMHGGISFPQAQGLSAAQQTPTYNEMWNSLSPSERARLQAEFGSNFANQSAMGGIKGTLPFLC